MRSACASCAPELTRIRNVSPGAIFLVISPYAHGTVVNLPGQSLRLWGHASHVASCGSHSAGRRKPSAAGVCFASLTGPPTAPLGGTAGSSRHRRQSGGHEGRASCAAPLRCVRDRPRRAGSLPYRVGPPPTRFPAGRTGRPSPSSLTLALAPVLNPSVAHVRRG